MKKLLSLALAAVIVMSSLNLAFAKDSYRKPITMTVFSDVSNFQGTQQGWFAKEMEKRFNVTFNIIGDDSYQRGMADGALGDLIIFGATGDRLIAAAKAGLLFDWDELDLSKYENISKYFGGSMAKISKFVEDETGLVGTWGVNNDVAYSSEGWSVSIDPNYGMQLRWDAYVAAGKPELKSLSDLPAFAKALQDAVSVNEKNEKVYFYGGFPDWEDCVMKFSADLLTWYGYSQIGHLFTNYATGEYIDPLTEGSLYYEALKINNQMYQNGTFDPESVSQTWDSYSTKVTNGRYLMALWGWLTTGYNSVENTSAGKGYVYFSVGDDTPLIDGLSETGANYVMSIGADCVDPERAMEIIEWMASPEGVMTLNSGPQGLTWDFDDSGKPFGTDFGWKCWDDGTNTTMPEEFGGGTYTDGQSALNIGLISSNDYAPVDNTYPYNHNIWEDGLARKVSNPVIEAWSDEYANGARTGVEYLQQTGKFSFHPANPYVVADMPEELALKRTVFSAIVKDYSWKCVYAANETEFEKLWNDMLKKVYDAGYREVTDWYIEQFDNKLAAMN